MEQFTHLAVGGIHINYSQRQLTFEWQWWITCKKKKKSIFYKRVTNDGCDILDTIYHYNSLPNSSTFFKWWSKLWNGGPNYIIEYGPRVNFQRHRLQ